MTLEHTIGFIEDYMSSYSEEDIVVDFHGGEPLLQFDKIRYTIDELNKIFIGRINYGITTNGTIISDNILDFLVKNFYYSLSISIDGSKEVHDRNRRLKNGNGSYEIVIKNAKKILERRDDVRARMTVNTETVNSLFSSVCALYQEGFKIIVPAVDYFDSEWDNEKLTVLFEQLQMIKAELKEGKLKAQIGLLDDYKSNVVKECTGGSKSFHISSNGEIYPCAFVVGNPQYTIGNVYDGLDSQKTQWFRNINQMPIQQCDGCSHERGCIATRCKILNRILMGDYYNPTPVICNVENVKYKIHK